MSDSKALVPATTLGGTGGMLKQGAGPGRPKGGINKTSRILREAVLMAAEKVGSDGKGKDGLIGFLEKHARKNPELFFGLLARIIPLPSAPSEDRPEGPVFLTREEVLARLRARGIPVENIYLDS
jgi:hypothetical protein